MAAVITDIHIAEAEVNAHKLPDEKMDSTTIAKPVFQKIFEKNRITKSEYEKSLSFYMDHPEQLDTVYQEVLKELSKMQVVPNPNPPRKGGNIYPFAGD